MSDLELIKKYVPAEKVEEAINKLNSGYPVQYIIGNVEFYGNIIHVNENVLIPRFETEYLVDKTIKYISKLSPAQINVLEIGTGSGCISIALKKHLDSTITAIDISKKALEVARENAKENEAPINFVLQDINKYTSNDKFDLVISNPPYVPYNSVVDEKTKYEPQTAIFAIENGLYFYRVILEKTKNNLKDNYLIAFEIGDKEGDIIKELAYTLLPGCIVKVEKDYNNFERYVFITNKREIIE